MACPLIRAARQVLALPVVGGASAPATQAGHCLLRPEPGFFFEQPWAVPAGMGGHRSHDLARPQFLPCERASAVTVLDVLEALRGADISVRLPSCCGLSWIAEEPGSTVTSGGVVEPGMLHPLSARLVVDQARGSAVVLAEGSAAVIPPKHRADQGFLRHLWVPGRGKCARRGGGEPDPPGARSSLPAGRVTAAVPRRHRLRPGAIPGAPPAAMGELLPQDGPPSGSTPCCPRVYSPSSVHDNSRTLQLPLRRRIFGYASQLPDPDSLRLRRRVGPAMWFWPGQARGDGCDGDCV